MEQSRRFLQVENADEAPQAQATPLAGGFLEEVMRSEEQETPLQTGRRGLARLPSPRAPESRKESAAESTLEQQSEETPAAEPVGQQQEEAAATVAESMKKQQWQEKDKVVEDAAAIPIGEPVKITGKRGKNQRKHYASFYYNGRTFDLEDSVLITPEKPTEKPYVAIIKDIIETEGSLTIIGQWFYRPEEVSGEDKFWVNRDTRELFYSFHIDDMPAESVMHKCAVHFIPQNKQFPARKKNPGFIVQNVYAATEKKLWSLTDKKYDKKKQEEINILLKKTVDRIGELPNLEPPCNKDFNVVDVTGESQVCKPKNFEKAEAPAGLTSAEKTSEPEQQRQLQMTDARYEKCQEKKVAMCGIIPAGHRDRYQLECTSCGYTWFSSHYAVSSAEGPSTATGAGSTVGGATTTREAAHKKKKQRAKSHK